MDQGRLPPQVGKAGTALVFTSAAALRSTVLHCPPSLLYQTPSSRPLQGLKQFWHTVVLLVKQGQAPPAAQALPIARRRRCLAGEHPLDGGRDSMAWHGGMVAWRGMVAIAWRGMAAW